MLPTRKQRVVDLLKSLETKDSAPLAFINPDKYIQHNLRVGPGLAGVTALIKNLPPEATVDTIRVFEDGDYVFAPGRINGAKRQSLLVESMEFCRSNVKLIVAGKAETKEDAETIKAIVRKRGLQNRVDFIERFITEDEKVEWLSRALACAYIPYDEDSYGYVTLESFLSKKPVLTCLDSGGIHELVKDHITGRIVASNAKALAAAMDALYENKASARRMGESGYDFAQTLDISWDRVIRVLTG